MTKPAQPTRAAQSTPFRFYDNRQKYLAFVNTCNEKAVIAARCADELTRLRPTPPAFRLFDAGMGDGTVLSRVLRTVHHQFPTVPVLVRRASAHGARRHEPPVRRRPRTLAGRRAERHDTELAGARGKTIASVYSVRPKPGAPVSTPLRWDELTEEVTPRRFGMREALERVERHGDLFAPVLAGGQALGRALKKLR